VRLVAEETEASFSSRTSFYEAMLRFQEARPDLAADRPPPPARVQQSIRLTEGSARTSGLVELDVRDDAFQVSGRLNCTDSDVSLHLDNATFNELLDIGLSAAVSEALAGFLSDSAIAVTPPLSVGGDVRRREGLSGLASFRVAQVATLSNDAAHQVLHLCVNVGAAGETGDLDTVRPFGDDRNFAYYVSEAIVAAVVRTRWARADTPKELESEIAVEMAVSEDSAETCTGRARVRFSFQDLSEVSLVATDGHPDTLRVTGNHEIQLLALWDCDDHRVADLGDLGHARVNPFALHVFLFGDAPETQEGPSRQVLEDLSRRLIEPIYRPIAAGSTASHRHIRGTVSSPLGSIFVRGDLELGGKK
jgi:hypothetical protein